MAVTSFASEPRAALAPAALPFAVAGAIFLILFINAPALLNDPDTYSHLALGRWIAAHQSVPMVDPLSATFAGRPWVAFEWLSDVVYWGAYTAFAWNGVALLAAGAMAGAFGTLAHFLSRRLSLIPLLLLVSAAFVLAAPHILARPHVLALLVMVTWTGLLLQASESGRTPSLALVALMTLWANLHGSFVVGLGLILPIALESVWYAAPPARRSLAVSWAIFAALAFLATLINPQVFGIYGVTYETFALGDALKIINEWQPPDFSHIGGFEVVLLAALGYALLTGMRLPWTRILMLLGLLHLALSQSRHADILGMLSPLFLMTPLAEHLGRTATPEASSPEAGRGILPMGAAAVLLVLLTAALVATRPLAPAARITPAAAVAAADLAHAGPVLNTYGFGAYLDFIGIPPFIDGRTELYGADFTLAHDNALNLKDLPGLLALLDKYKIRATLLAPGTPAIAMLDRLPNWQRVYGDRVAVAHIRKD